MKATKTKQRPDEKAIQSLTAVERTAIQKFLAKSAAKPSVRYTVTKNGGHQQITVGHPDKIIGQLLVMDALGSADCAFVDGIVNQLANASRGDGDIDERSLNFMLSVIKGIEPRDQLETMLGAQMAAVHMASMKFGQQLAHVKTIDQQDSAERAFNKLTRTFAMQMEALKRYRTGAEQKVTLQHVSVAEGGQAIVGNVTQALGENMPGKAAPPLPAGPDTLARPDAPAPADTNVVPMPIMGKSDATDPLSMPRKSVK